MMLQTKHKKWAGLTVPIYLQDSPREPLSDWFARRSGDRKEGEAEILEVTGVWTNVIRAKVRFTDYDITCTRFISRADIQTAMASQRSEPVGAATI